MQSLIIYDETGYILDIRSGEPSPREPVGVPFMWVDVPVGKKVVSIDVSVSPHQPILEDIPPSDIEQLRNDLDSAILELTLLIAMQGGNR